MAARTVVVRRAGASDAPLLQRVVGEAGGAAGPGAEPAREPQREAPPAGAVLLRLLEHPDVEVHLAVAPREDDEEVVGLVVLRRGAVVLPVPAPVVHVEQLWVVPSWRRRGVGHQLLAAVAAAAEAGGAEEVTAVASSGERDVQRFLARLGFTRPLVHRTAPLPVLRARLAAAVPPGGVRGRRRAALDQLVARRRRQLGAAGAGAPAEDPGAPVGPAAAAPLSAAERPAAGT